MVNKIDWNQIQSVYDSDKIGIRELCSRFGISTSRIQRATKKGIFKSRDKDELRKIKVEKGKKRKHSKEAKDKISKSRIKFLLENPDMVPYKLNHSSKESYPEKYFTDVFNKEGISVTRYHRIGLYELDFCIIDSKIDIEIDGSQHIYDLKIKKSDIRRDKFLRKNGWTIIRINWAEYKKLDIIDRSKFIIELKNKMTPFP